MAGIIELLFANISIVNAFIAIAVYYLLTYICSFVRARAKLPAGPFPLPVVGNTFTLKKKPEVELMKLQSKYGDIFTVFIGSRPCVVLNGAKMIKEALLKNAVGFAGRPNLQLFKFFEAPDGSLKGISAADYSQTLRFHRKIAHNAFRNYTLPGGTDSKRFEEVVRNEIVQLVNYIESQESKPFDIYDRLLNSVINLIFTVCFGPGRLQQYLDKKAVDALLRAMYSFDDYILMNNYFDTFPILTTIFIKLITLIPNEVGDVMERLITMLKTELDIHQKTFDPNIIRDVTDAMIKAKHEAEEEEKTDKAAMLDDKTLLGTIGDLFFAGFQTTAYTIYWYFLYIVTHPEAQRKVHDELDQYVGRDKYPTLADRGKLNYLEATIQETLRLSTIVPTSLPHTPTKDVEIADHVIPRGTAVWVNLWSVHQDESLWPNANQYQPERFIDENGKLTKSSNWMPFSIGTRMCIGESLARYELYMYVAHLMNAFEFRKIDDNTKYDLTPKAGLIHSCSAYKMIAIPRNSSK